MQQQAGQHAAPKRPAVRPQPNSQPAPLPANLDLAHELRTSLAVITLLSGNLDLLYERLNDGERQKMIRDIRKHTQKLNELVAGVLALSGERESLA